MMGYVVYENAGASRAECLSTASVAIGSTVQTSAFAMDYQLSFTSRA
jgi:hypothetical protein